MPEPKPKRPHSTVVTKPKAESIEAAVVNFTDPTEPVAVPMVRQIPAAPRPFKSGSIWSAGSDDEMEDRWVMGRDLWRVDSQKPIVQWVQPNTPGAYKVRVPKSRP